MNISNRDFGPCGLSVVVAVFVRGLRYTDSQMSPTYTGWIKAVQKFWVRLHIYPDALQLPFAMT